MIDEIRKGPPKLRREFDGLTERMRFRMLQLSEEARDLARRYILEGIIPQGERNDALHLALATIAVMDMVISWNFGHMVKVSRIRGVNGVNLIHGYHQIDVRSPEEVYDG